MEVSLLRVNDINLHVKTTFLSIAFIVSTLLSNAHEIRKPSGLQGIKIAEQFYCLPFFKTGTQTYQYSSTDPLEDQFNDYSHWLYNDKDSNAVLADISGPGCIYRIWSTGNNGETNRIKIYIDGKSGPSIDQTFNQFHNYPPLRQKPQIGSGGDKYIAWWSYMPIPFEKSCRIVRQGKLEPFYSITYHTYTKADGLKSWNGSENYKNMEQMWEHPDLDPKATKENRTLQKFIKLAPGVKETVWQQKGPGSIASIKISDYLPEKEFRIKIYWDGELIPSVDAPVKWFFGSIDNGGDLKALGIGTVKNCGYCYFPMPFWRNAKIVLENNSFLQSDSMKIEIQYSPMSYPEKQCGYFHKEVNEEVNQKNKYTCLKTSGRGHVIGMAKRMPKGGHACEGDEIFYIDNRRFPDIYGTGEEDYNNCAWWPNSYNSYPTHGCIGNDCYYRMHFPDMVIYEEALDMEFETWVPFYIASIVWYYEKNQPSIVMTDSLDIKNVDSEKIHEYKISGEIWSGVKHGIYPGKKIYNDTVSDDGRSFKGFSQFKINIDPENKGVRLRVRTDNGEIQVAKIWVDENPIKERLWEICKNRFDAIWIDSDFEIPVKYTKGKKSIRIKIEYSPESKKPWAEYNYLAFSYLY
jgi:hypothetical protein